MPEPTPSLPFAVALEALYGEAAAPPLERRVSDLRGLCADEAARAALEAAGNPVVYRVAGPRVPERAGELPFSVTTVEPGTVGDEFHFTKGHWHETPAGELYLGLEGEGLLVLFDGREARWLELAAGVAGYIPPGWAHRTVNTGPGPLRFLAVYPGDAGHDYARVAREGLGVRVLRSPLGYRVEPARP